MFYYAVVNGKDVVETIECLESEVDYYEYISIETEDWSLCGKWYDRNGKYGTIGAFIDQPISIQAEHTTGQINYKDQDIWLDEKLDSYATRTELASGLSGKANIIHTHSNATQEMDGYLSNSDKTKLDGIEANANNYVHPESHAISMITETDSQKIMTAAERTKLSGIAENANNYSHPATHSIEMIQETSTKKIMTADERTKLSGIEENANNYVHPTSHAASMITGLSEVATTGSYNDLSDKPSIPSAYTHPASHPASMITGLADVATSGSYADLSNIPSTFAPSSHSHAQSEISGLSTALNSKANATHSHAQSEITGLETALSGKASTSHTHSAATTSAAGFMSKSDKSKLDGIATGANKTTVDSALSSTSTNPVQNKVINTALAGKASTSHTHTGFAPATEDTTKAGCYYRMVSGKKEWINPPMIAGTEYCTTERYKGKNVYVKHIAANVAAITTNGGYKDVAVAHNISNYEYTVRVFGSYQSSGNPLPYHGTGKSASIVNVGTNSITLRSINKDWEAGVWNFTLYYTKS